MVRVLNRLILERGVPKVLFCDNGAEFTGQMMDMWAYRNGVKIDFSRPGKTTDNAFCESFNGTFRAECLDTALDFLIKPFDFDTLLNAVRNAIKRSELMLRREAELRRLRMDYESLSRREREVMAGVASGLLNKEVATELGISEITVKVHRGSVMRKMKADSFAHLVNMAARLRVTRYLTTSAA